MKYLQGMLVFHKQLGLGVVDKETKKGVWVLFIGTAPKVLADKNCLELVILNQEEKFKIHMIAKNAVKRLNNK